MKKAMFEGSTARKLPIDRLPRKQFTVLLTRSGRVNIKGPDGQTVIDQGTIDTDEFFASDATIRSSLTLGTGGLIKSGNFVAGSSGFRVLATGEAEFSEVTIRGIDSSVGGNAVFNDVTVNGTLTMNNGEIRNSGNDFSVDSNGFNVSPSSSYVLTKSYAIDDGNVGRIYGDSGAMNVEAAGTSDLNLIANNGERIYVQTTGFITIGLAGSELSFFGKTSGSTKPSITGGTGGLSGLENLLTALDSMGLISDNT